MQHPNLNEKLKKKLVKLIKKSSRATLPSSKLKCKIIPSKKQTLLEKIIKRESRRAGLKGD
jgi:hypothetical protein